MLDRQTLFPRFRADLHLLGAEDGGRRSNVLPGGTYRPQFQLGSIDRSTSLFLETIEGADLLEPGVRAEVWFTLLLPEFFEGQLQPGAEFTISEGSRVVGGGTIREVRLAPA